MTRLVSTTLPALAVGAVAVSDASSAYLYAAITLAAAVHTITRGHARVPTLTRWFGLALLLFGLADLAFAAGVMGELLYLAGYGVLAGTALTALAGLGPRQLREGLLDAGLLSFTALGLLLPLMSETATGQVPVGAAYFVATAGLTAVWLRVVVARPGISPAAVATSVALIAGLVGTTVQILAPDTSVALLRTLHATARWGLALGATHASFHELFRRDLTERERDTSGRTMVMVAALVATSFAAARGAAQDAPSMLTAALVLLPAPLAVLIARRIMRSIRTHVQVQEQMRAAASRDPVTGLRNAAGLDDALTHDDRFASDGTLILLVVDGLRELMRRLPDDASRELLTRLRTRISCDLGSSDVVGRCDTDEFAVLTTRDAAALAARLTDRLSRPLALENSAASFTPSLRCGWVPVDGLDTRSLLLRARFAAGEARPNGTPVGFDDRLAETHERQRRILRALPTAIAAGKVSSHYQPIVNLSDGRIVGFEALARWQDDELGRVGPMEFIPLAESSGAIIPLGTRLLREACAQIAGWRADHERDDLYVTVNVSAHQLEDDAFPSIVSAALHAAGLPPHALTLELTEGVLLREGADEAAAVLSAVRAMGVRLAVDDFGTGYSSLAYLQRFRPDVVKIDRSFTRELGTASGDVATGVFAMLDQLGWRVVAEGIELQESVTILRGLACEMGQGYLLSPPLPPSGITELLVNGVTDLTANDTTTPLTSSNASMPAGDDTGTAIADLVEPAVIVEASMSCADVERLFHETARLEMVVVRREDGLLAPLAASRVLTALTGRYAYGRALNGTRPIGDLVPRPVRALSADTSYVDAVAMALARPEDERYDDLVVDGDVVGRLSVGRLLEAIAESLADQAARDPLTGIPNRRHLTRQLQQVVAERRSVGLLLLDLDAFKPVNDTHGHAAGDAVLVAVAQRLRACARPRDVVARLGGDEFAIIVEGDEHATAQVAKRCATVLQGPIDIGTAIVTVGGSIGTAWGLWDDADRALATADTAMYDAKRAGGGRVVVSSAAAAGP